MTGFYWIASYPKSGNTWLRLALYCLLHPQLPFASPEQARFAPNASRRNDIEDALDIESGDLTADEVRVMRPAAYRAMAREAARPLYRKVHDAWTHAAPGLPLFPPDVTLGTLHIVRDPRDVAVSLAHFAAVTLDKAVDILCDPASVLNTRSGRPPLMLPQTLLCWSGHTKSWLDAPGRPGCLLRYEDMLADPVAVLRRVAQYAGIAHDEADLRRAVAATRFEALREQEIKHGFDGGQAASVPFFRAGRAGDWRKTMNRMQVERICGAHREMMERLGYLRSRRLEEELPSC